MPKENINDISGSGFRAEVNWKADGYVQVATVNPASTLTIESDDGQQADPFDGWHVTLDRDGINRMIRSLRRARDAAFGADA